MPNNHTYLYVEDDMLSRQIMQTIMGQAMNIKNLVIFEDSNDFMARVNGLPVKPTIFLLDIHVKPLDGFAMLELLRADPDYRRAKTVALTASVMNEEVDRLRSSGFDGAIAKPLTIRTFPGLIERIVRGEAVWHIA